MSGESKNEVSFRGDLVPAHPERVGPPPGVSEEEWAAVPPERKTTVSYARTAKPYRMARVDSLGIGDFIEHEDYGEHGLYGEITRVSGPFTDTGEGHEWFTFRVQPDGLTYEREPTFPVTVGPMRADRLVKCWS